MPQLFPLFILCLSIYEYKPSRMATGSKDEYCMGETQGEAIEVLVLNICAFVQGYMEFCCMP